VKRARRDHGPCVQVRLERQTVFFAFYLRGRRRELFANSTLDELFPLVLRRRALAPQRALDVRPG
jgi:hypothetical protein